MRVLYVGGTGIISSACVEESLRLGQDVCLLNRGTSTKYLPPPGVTVITGDVKGDQGALRALLAANGPFDVVADFITFTPEELESRLTLLEGLAQQFVFVSSASCDFSSAESTAFPCMKRAAVET